MDVVKSEFTKLTSCSLHLEQKIRAVPMIIQMIKKNERDMWEKLKNKLKRRTKKPVDIKTRCNVKNFTTEHTVLSVQGQAFYILHLDQKTRKKVPTLNEEKQLTGGDRSSIVRLIEKHGEKTIVQHTKAVIKPNSSSPPLSQLTTTRCDSMAHCSDSISLTNSFTSTCTGSFPTEHSMRTKETGERGDEMKQAAASSSTGVGSIGNSGDSTSETESVTCNNVLKQVTSDPVDVTTLAKNNQTMSETGEERIGKKCQ